MNQFCFALRVDGDDLPLRTSEAENAEAAAEIGCALLHLQVQLRHPETVNCVVYSNLGDDAQPLGAWEYSRAEPKPRWMPARTDG